MNFNQPWIWEFSNNLWVSWLESCFLRRTLTLFQWKQLSHIRVLHVTAVRNKCLSLHCHVSWCPSSSLGTSPAHSFCSYASGLMWACTYRKIHQAGKSCLLVGNAHTLISKQFEWMWPPPELTPILLQLQSLQLCPDTQLTWNTSS